MSILTIRASTDGRAFDPDDANALRFDLEREVGEVQPPTTTDVGAKGPELDLVTIAVAVLSAPAITALIGLLKARLERDESTEFVVEGPGGKVTFKGRDRSIVSSADFSRLIERVLGQVKKGVGDASSSPGSSQPV